MQAKRACKTEREVRRQFGRKVWVVGGLIGKQKTPSQIIDGETGQGYVKEGLYHQGKIFIWRSKFFQKDWNTLGEKHLVRIQFDA